ncbi:LytR/AlgR family response regulator transcription factor [Geofilum rubicundum]|uniref:Two-component system response regulator n=1 Tax=Geofilum rubicundum JCM 15548 TaxID=1236989 RepID=A0A0E9M132_9BACT|nr:LytTR family DNA-binding domain-containing protein [Geofilum rubicundum]GAO30850.1 two-component system response regulator [Geofilum rubicundum JCM 15548]
MHVVIIEDEAFAALRLKKMIQDFNPEIKILAELESVAESVKWFKSNPEPDLIFLDIHLEDDLSFAIFDQVNISSPVIFTTAFDEYAIKAFKLKSIDYLLKPIVHEELAAALKKYEQFSGLHPKSIDLQSLYNLLTTNEKKYRERLSISVGPKIKMVEVKEIAYFFVMDKGVYLRTSTGSTYNIDFTLDKLEELLNPDSFLRINRKYVINITSISQMISYSRGRVKLELHPKADNEFDTIVSIDRSAKFKKWINR